MKPKPKLVLHIGTPKTGTTSLQLYLADNRNKLLNKSILYPKITNIKGSIFNHHLLAKSILKAVAYSKYDEYHKYINLIKNHIKQYNPKTVIISSEYFFWHEDPHFKFAFDRFHNIFQSIDVVMYCRPQVEYLNSIYNQLAKDVFMAPEVRINGGFDCTDMSTHFQKHWEYIVPGNGLFYSKYLSSLNKHLNSKDNIIVKSYNMIPNVISDFTDCFNINKKNLFYYKNKNPSLGWKAMLCAFELASKHNGYTKTPVLKHNFQKTPKDRQSQLDFNSAIYHLKKMGYDGWHSKAPNYANHDLQEIIYNKYYQDNLELQQKYFSDNTNDPLFTFKYADIDNHKLSNIPKKELEIFYNTQS